MQLVLVGFNGFLLVLTKTITSRGGAASGNSLLFSLGGWGGGHPEVKRTFSDKPGSIRTFP